MYNHEGNGYLKSGISEILNYTKIVQKFSKKKSGQKE